MSQPTVTPAPQRPVTPARRGGALRTASIASAAFLVLALALGATWLAVASGYEDAKPAKNVGPALDPNAVAAGRQLTMARGCVTCHSDDGSPNRGPTYKGLFGSTVIYTDGTTGLIDDVEVRDALVHPAAKVIDGFEPLMPPAKLSEDEQKNLIAYLRSIGAGK